MMLRQNLVASHDGVTPSTDPEIQDRYEEALQNLLAELEDDGKVTIASQDSD